MVKERYYIVTAKSGLNIRFGPGTDYVRIGILETGEEIISPETKGWVPILLDDDSIGWVYGKYLQDAPEGKPGPLETQIVPSKISGVSFPIFQRNLTRKFGTPNYQQFSRKYVVNIDLSEFADYLTHVRTFNGKPFTSIEGHRLLAEPLKMALRLVCERGLARELKTYDGCFNIREMKSGNRLSVHSWGLAVDFNARTSPFQNRKSPTWPDMVTDFSDDFVRCFTEAGFEWGGLWNSIYDPMHFQLPWISDWRESSEELRPMVYSEEAPAAEEIKPEKIPIVPVEFDFSNKESTIAAIKAECQKQGIGLPTQIAYVLATTDWETGHTFEPVREAYWENEEWRQRNFSRYYPYYGRGYVQLTWEANYRKYSEVLGIDLVSAPDLAMEPQNALFILVHGFKTGAFTGKKISDYINAGKTDFYNARRCINRLDRAKKIAAIAKKFLKA